MISIDDLVVTQSGFRYSDQIKGMVGFVSKGGRFDRFSLEKYSAGKDLRPIKVVKFEDGRMFIHDGHHRVAAIYLGGRSELYPEEYVVQEWKYEDYIVINIEAGWVTPFDPRTDVRLPDYSSFKSEVTRRLQQGKREAIWFIDNCKEGYLRPRSVLTIKDLLRYI